jgi:hypothetical protein
MSNATWRSGSLGARELSQAEPTIVDAVRCFNDTDSNCAAARCFSDTDSKLRCRPLPADRYTLSAANVGTVLRARASNDKPKTTLLPAAR